MKKKKILSAVVSAAVAVGCMYVMPETELFEPLEVEALVDGSYFEIGNLVGGISDYDGSAYITCTLYDAANITVPDYILGCPVKRIEAAAFSDIDCLVSVSIGSNVEIIGKSAFVRSNNLEYISVAAGNTHYSDIDGVLFKGSNPKPYELVTYPAGRTDETYTIPEGISVIGESGFWDAKNLKSITIPESVKSIGKDAFSGCTKLTTIYGYENSTAQSYAREKGYKFVAAIKGDSNGDKVVNARDCAFIASSLAKGKGNTLPASADFNKDGKINVRDAAAIAKFLATGKK